MKEKIREIIWDFVAGEVTDSEAVQQVLDLFAVAGRSEQLKALLSKVVDEFDSGEVTWDTRDEIESVLKSL